MRAIWKGAVSFGLVNVPVRLYAATGEHDIRFHQVHRSDGGRIKMKRTCSVDGEEVGYDQVAKGYESPDGKLVVLTDEDLAELPVASGHEIDVIQFVPADQVDPVLLAKPYYLEPEARAAKPYALLREALAETDRMAVVKVALRQRETLAVLRVRGKAIVLQTMLWPDEVREAEFEVLDSEVELRPQEMQMAASLVESLAADFHPEEFEDEYSVAVRNLIDARLEDADAAPAVAAADDGGNRGGEVVDLLTALQRSVDRARGAAPKAQERSAEVAEEDAPPAAAKRTSAPAKKTAATKTAAKKAPAKKTAAKSTTKKATTAKSTSTPRKTTARKSA
ncbi:non-homologous end joining protein Ku [Kineococcus rubinsiae]|uniref:non-homologous end joining protein Ku n=1 Tax=Kineococcus rubinsiae TaxID=2609562 RepID=UPI001431A238|nr:Ku protein [Kineococcus rubinsiae]NIZ90612.1 Ku protein [Kineococcus rubinsiae]